MAEPLQSGATYRLRVKIGNDTIHSFTDYAVELRAGGEVLARDPGTLVPPDGEFVTSEIFFTPGPSHNALLGLPLEIRLVPVLPDLNDGVSFDDVQLCKFAPPTEPGAFAFINVADNTGQLVFEHSAAVLNNVGTVAFFATEAGSKGLFVARVDPQNPPNTIDHRHLVGHPCPPGGGSGPFTDFPILPGVGKPALNDEGAEAFMAHCGGVQGVYRHVGLGVGVVADNGSHPPPNPPASIAFREVVAIDAQGRVAYTVLDGSLGVVTYRDQTEVVRTPGSPGSYTNLSYPLMNSQGDVAFLAIGDQPGEELISKAVPVGTTPQLCVDNFTQINGLDFRTFNPSTPINDDGLIAFSGGMDDFTGGVYRANAACDSIATIDTAPTGNIGPAGINDSGHVAYWKGGKVLVVDDSGIPRKVVGAGDDLAFINSLVSGVVTEVGLAQGNFLDNSGRIAFRYTLAGGTTGVAVAAPACSDGIDNDGDGPVDHGEDLGCDSPADDSEKRPPSPRGWQLVCDDGVDNDGDGLVDYPFDPGCYFPTGNSENPACADGLDNDGDGAIDHPADPQCTWPWKTSESTVAVVICGIGFELVFVLPPLMWLHRRRRLC